MCPHILRPGFPQTLTLTIEAMEVTLMDRHITYYSEVGQSWKEKSDSIGQAQGSAQTEGSFCAASQLNSVP